MSARDDYPLMVLRWQGDMATVDSRIDQHEAMCDEIDRLRALLHVQEQAFDADTKAAVAEYNRLKDALDPAIRLGSE